MVFENNTANLGADIYQTSSGVTNIAGEGGSVTINGGVAGEGKINKTGNGTLVLNGDNSDYTGTFPKQQVKLLLMTVQNFSMEKLLSAAEHLNG